VLFTDRDLGKRFPAILADGGLTVETHAAHFSEAAPDEEWLPIVARSGWIVVTHDARMRYKANERDAIVSNRIALLLIVGSAPHADLAHSFVRTRDKIESFVRENTPPYIAKIFRAEPRDLLRNPHAKGRIELWYPRS
jgi:PIN like domain